jgi:hypothetical protein
MLLNSRHLVNTINFFDFNNYFTENCKILDDDHYFSCEDAIIALKTDAFDVDVHII